MLNHICILSGSSAAMMRDETPPCQILPITDDPLTDITPTPPPLIPVTKPSQNTPQKPPPPLPPKVIYQPIIPYYVLPPNPAVYGQGAVNARFTQAGGRLLPHSPFSAPGFLSALQRFLDLQRDKHLPAGRFPHSGSSPTGNLRGSLLAERFHPASSEMSSEEESDGD